MNQWYVFHQNFRQISMIENQVSDELNKEPNTRGPYNSVAKGMLPKRGTQEAVQKLVDKEC